MSLLVHPRGARGPSAVCNLTKNLIPSLPTLAAGICSQSREIHPAAFPTRPGSLTVGCGTVLFPWKPVPDILSPASSPRQAAMTGCALPPFVPLTRACQCFRAECLRHKSLRARACRRRWPSAHGTYKNPIYTRALFNHFTPGAGL